MIGQTKTVRGKQKWSVLKIGLLVVFVIAAVLAGMSLLPAWLTRFDQNAYIRVNQVGYEMGQPMRAYVLAIASEAGARYVVHNGVREATSGTVGATTGKWGNYSVFPIDFSVTSPGEYTIFIVHSLPATSPKFRVDSAQQLFAVPLQHALQFFQSQRDGRDYVASTLRPAPSHLNDARATVYRPPGHNFMLRIKGDLRETGTVTDVEGGWWDAGDYLKFVHTTSFVEALMLAGVRDFPAQMGAGASTNFAAEAKFGLDWLLKMWDDRTATLYYQVGIGTGNWGFEDDHSVWRLPQVDDTYGGNNPHYRYIRNRPVLLAGPAGSRVSPNLAGRLAADFALGSSVFRASNPEYANRCLLAAQHIFDLADTAPTGELLTASPHDFYDESEWNDDLELGATEIYLAMRAKALPPGLPHADANFYLNAAARWAGEYLQSHPDGGDLLGVADMSGLAHFDLYRALDLAHASARLAVTQADLLNALHAKLERATEQARKDPFGFGYPWGGGDTPTHGAALAVIADEYGYLSHSDSYANLTRGSLDNILGANAWGVSFIIGDGSTFPHCMHHQVANLTGSLDGTPPIVAGALVEGPVGNASSGSPRGVKACPASGGDEFKRFDRNGAEYRDGVKYWSTNEPAIDLTAPSFLAFAWRIAGTVAPLEEPQEATVRKAGL